MTTIHRNENTRVVRTGGGLYLNPYQGNGLYLNRGGFIGIGEIVRAVSDIGKSGLNFAINNKELIKDGIEAGSHIASAISNIKKASDEAEKLKLLKNIKKETKKQNKLTDEEKKIIDDAIGNVVVEGKGLKRF
jgi:hypothetical protein